MIVDGKTCVCVIKHRLGRFSLYPPRTGVDKGKLEAFRWEDFEGADLYIRRKIWEGTEKYPKTGARKAPIPVIPHLRKMIEQYRESEGSPREGWVFTASRGKKPIRMDNLARREIKLDLKKAGTEWHGWHAYRRGFATNLRELGIARRYHPAHSASCATAMSPPCKNTTPRPSRHR